MSHHRSVSKRVWNDSGAHIKKLNDPRARPRPRPGGCRSCRLCRRGSGLFIGEKMNTCDPPDAVRLRANDQRGSDDGTTRGQNRARSLRRRRHPATARRTRTTRRATTARRAGDGLGRIRQRPRPAVRAHPGHRVVPVGALAGCLHDSALPARHPVVGGRPPGDRRVRSDRFRRHRAAGGGPAPDGRNSGGRPGGRHRHRAGRGRRPGLRRPLPLPGHLGLRGVRAAAQPPAPNGAACSGPSPAAEREELVRPAGLLDRSSRRNAPT